MLKDKRSPVAPPIRFVSRWLNCRDSSTGVGPDRRQTGYVDSVASKGIPTLLEVEVSFERTTASSDRCARVLRVLKTPYRSPQANSFCERLIGSARRECLDFMIPINEGHVRWIMKRWTTHYNQTRPHSSLGPGIPDANFQKAELQCKRHCIPQNHRVSVTPILGGLHHEYRLQKIAA